MMLSALPSAPQEHRFEPDPPADRAIGVKWRAERAAVALTALRID